jgi:protein SCO1/2
MTRLYAIIATAAVLVGLGASALWVLWPRPEDRFAQCRESVIAGGAGAIGGPFALTGPDGVRRTDADIITKPTLLYFGYAFCPDVCPMDNQRNAEAVDLLVTEGHDVQPVFISVDPARDTPEVLADFASWAHPRMIALTGTEEELREAARAYRVYFKAQEVVDDFYLVDHTTFTYLVLPDHGFVDFFRREATPAEVAERTACFLGLQ